MRSSDTDTASRPGGEATNNKPGTKRLRDALAFFGNWFDAGTPFDRRKLIPVFVVLVLTALASAHFSMRALREQGIAAASADLEASLRDQLIWLDAERSQFLAANPTVQPSAETKSAFRDKKLTTSAAQHNALTELIARSSGATVDAPVDAVDQAGGQDRAKGDPAAQRLSLPLHLLAFLESARPVPVGDTSRELLIATVDKGNLEYLYRSGAAEGAGRLSVPLADTGKATAMRAALQGNRGVTSATDHRGERVIAAYAPVEGLGGAVLKVDYAELVSPYNRQSLAIVGASLLMSALACGTLFFMFSSRGRQPSTAAIRAERFERTVQDSAEAIVWIAEDGRIEYANDRAIDFFEITENTASTLYFSDLCPQMQRENWDNLIKQLDEHGRYSFEARIKRATGIERNVEIGVSRIESANGSLVAAFVRNITAQKKAVDAISRQNSEYQEQLKRVDQYNQMLDASNDSIYLIDRSYTVIALNQRFAELHEGTTDTLRGQRLEYVIGPKRFNALKPRLVRCFNGIETEFTETLEDGGVPVELNARYVPLRSVDGGVVNGAVYIGRDVSRERFIEYKQDRADANLLALMAHLDAAAALMDESGRVLEINEAFTGLYGYTPDLAKGKELHKLVGADAAAVGSTTGASEFGGKQRCTHRTRAEVEIEVETFRSPVLFAGADVMLVLAQPYAINSAEDGQPEPVPGDTRYELLCAELKCVTRDWDIASSILEWDEHSEAVFGIRQTEMPQMLALFAERVHELDRDRVMAGLQNVITRGEARWSMQYRFANAEGAFLTIRESGTVLRDAEGLPARAISVLRDVSDLCAAEADVANACDAIEKLESEKAFHQANLRESIAPAALEILRIAEQWMRSEAADRASCDRLRARANSLLEAVGEPSFADVGVPDPAQAVPVGETDAHPVKAAIELPQADFKPRTFGLHQLLDEIRERYSEVCEFSSVMLDVERFSDTPDRIHADEGKLRVILNALVDNASKYTLSGGITLRARLVDKGDNKLVRIRIEVEDTGLGIAPQDCERILNGPLLPADGETQTANIAQCKHLAECMRGRLSLTSKLDIGSTFTLEFPAQLK